MWPGLARVVPFNVCVRGSVATNRLLPSSMAQHPILNGTFVQGKALQALVYEVVLW